MTAGPLSIRPATPGDATVLWAMLQPVFRAGDTYAVDPAISREDALAYWTGSDHHVFIAEDAAPLGTYYLKTNQQGGGAHVCNAAFVTAEAARGKGVARAMLDHALITAKETGYEAMQFNFVVAANTRAVDLWTHAGFETVGRLPKAFRLPDGAYTDALVMHRFLGKA
ncbi:N-acetyltransferase family protein [Aestuariibius sp. 2305UL40-4]|uniref:GNAT family N-acetyltransferase n=1 Tax=Aestuariibius violaceus TaxID=3234132 RepID=UPI0034807D2B